MPDGTKNRAEELAKGYTWRHRVYELGGITGAFIMGSWLTIRLVRSPAISGWWVPLGLFLGILAADFVSGFAHWLFDSWGNLDTPVLGKLAIRTFREHHVDQKAITRHDFIETNGHNLGLSIVPSSLGVYVLDPEAPSLGTTFAGMFLIFMALFVGSTSQIHKWAHQTRPGVVVRFLQRMHLVLAPEHHALHHEPPYDRNYCITVGWLNGPLRAVRFFQILERVITALTGAVPRLDDIGEKQALADLAAKASEGEQKIELPEGS